LQAGPENDADPPQFREHPRRLPNEVRRDGDGLPDGDRDAVAPESDTHPHPDADTDARWHAEADRNRDRTSAGQDAHALEDRCAIGSGLLVSRRRRPELR